MAAHNEALAPFLEPVSHRLSQLEEEPNGQELNGRNTNSQEPNGQELNGQDSNGQESYGLEPNGQDSNGPEEEGQQEGSLEAETSGVGVEASAVGLVQPVADMDGQEGVEEEGREEEAEEEEETDAEEDVGGAGAAGVQEREEEGGREEEEGGREEEEEDEEGEEEVQEEAAHVDAAARAALEEEVEADAFPGCVPFLHACTVSVCVAVCMLRTVTRLRALVEPCLTPARAPLVHASPNTQPSITDVCFLGP